MTGMGTCEQMIHTSVYTRCVYSDKIEIHRNSMLKK